MCIYSNVQVDADRYRCVYTGTYRCVYTGYVQVCIYRYVQVEQTTHLTLSSGSDCRYIKQLPRVILYTGQHEYRDGASLFLENTQYVLSVQRLFTL